MPKDTSPAKPQPMASQVVIFLGTQTLSFWDNDPARTNSSFAKDFDPEYFERLSKLILPLVKDDPTNGYSRSIRQLYIQSCECTFALLFSILQATPYPLGWLTKYRNKDLLTQIQLVSDHKAVPILISPKPAHPGWKGIAELFIGRALDPSPTDMEEYIEKHAQFLWKIAEDFTSPFTLNDYNSIKHGLRGSVRPFGVQLSAQHEGPSQPGAGLLLEAFSNHGSHFSRATRIDALNSKNHYMFEMLSTSWDPPKLANRISYLSMWNRVLKRALLQLAEQKIENISLPKTDDLTEPPHEGIVIDDVKIRDAMRFPHPGDLPPLPKSDDPRFLWPVPSTTT